MSRWVSMTTETATTPSRAENRAAIRRRRRRRIVIPILVVAMLLIGTGGLATVLLGKATTASEQALPSLPSQQSTGSSTSTSTTTTTQPPGAGFIAGKVTAIGDSVMVDYQTPLEQDIPGITVDGAVSRQWYEGEQILTTLKAQNQLGATVIVGLSTNGPISAADVDQMMSILSGASRVIFVNIHVDQPWQDPNNAVLAAAASRYPTVTVVDWNTLAGQHPEWFGADGTHLAINGTAAHALAALIAGTIS